jgi:hypothetical protein
LQKYESGVCVTDLANMYSMSTSTLFYYKKVRYGVPWGVQNALWVFLMGKIVLTYDLLELRPALANELSS